jgi:DNA-binding NtrC family response regulator
MPATVLSAKTNAVTSGWTKVMSFATDELSSAVFFIMRIEGSVTLANRNPYGDASNRWHEALGNVRKRGASLLDGHVADSTAEAAALALLLASAVAGSEPPPARVFRRLPRPRGHYVRIAFAAARCVKALNALVGDSPAMQSVREQTWKACFGESLDQALLLDRVIRDHDVLVLGETGTGKESVAHAIQEGTPGGDDGRPAPRSTLNAAAVPDTLVESELFGHEKGAFTGASTTRIGRVRSASGGCFFLDEVGDLPSTVQVKLLRVMELDEVSPLGADEAYDADLRWVAATHRDLEVMVRAGEFRHDLYQRLAGHVIHIPPLRERPEDIVTIGAAFLVRYPAPPQVNARANAWLSSAEARTYSWPGNVRELENALRNLLLGSRPLVAPRTVQVEAPATIESLPADVAAATAPLAAVCRWYAARALAAADGNRSLAARRLDIDRATLRRHLEGG